jgi:hypothetical protein
MTSFRGEELNLIGFGHLSCERFTHEAASELDVCSPFHYAVVAEPGPEELSFGVCFRDQPEWLILHEMPS